MFVKKLRKIIFSIMAACLIGIIFLIGYGCKENELSTYEQEIIILNEIYPSDIMIYGENISFKDSLKYRMISQISEEELDGSKFQYHFIIINDLSGSASLTQDEANLIMSYINEKHYTFFYIGSNYEDIFLKSGILEDPISSDCRGFQTGYEYGWVLSCGTEFITTQDIDEFKIYPQLLGECLVRNMVDVIKTEN